jgi:hypothetical protein
VALKDEIDRFLKQDVEENAPYEETLRWLYQLASHA